MFQTPEISGKYGLSAASHRLEDAAAYVPETRGVADQALRQALTCDGLADRFFALSGRRVRREQLCHQARVAALDGAELGEDRDRLAGIVAGARHELHHHRIRLSLGLPAEVELAGRDAE